MTRQVRLTHDNPANEDCPSSLPTDQGLRNDHAADPASPDADVQTLRYWMDDSTEVIDGAKEDEELQLANLRKRIVAVSPILIAACRAEGLSVAAVGTPSPRSSRRPTTCSRSASAARPNHYASRSCGRSPAWTINSSGETARCAAPPPLPTWSAGASREDSGPARIGIHPACGCRRRQRRQHDYATMGRADRRVPSGDVGRRHLGRGRLDLYGSQGTQRWPLAIRPSVSSLR